MAPSDKLRILVSFNSRFPWQTGGRETGMYNISRELRERMHFTFLTYYLGPSRRRFDGFQDLQEWADVVPVRIPRSLPYPVGAFVGLAVLWHFGRNLFRTAKRRGPFDLVMALNGGPTAAHAQRVSRCFNMPSVINYRSDWPAEVTERWPMTLFRNRWTRMETRNLTKANLLLANGRDTADMLRQRLGDSGSKIVALCNGVNTDLFHPRSQHEPRRWPEDKVVFFSNSTLRSLKGLDVAMRCVARMNSEVRRQVHLVLAGRGIWEPYRQMASELGITEHVEYLGELPHDELARPLREADVGIFPASLGVGTQHASLECLASGLPLVAYTFADYPSLIDEGRTGYLLPMGDEAGFQAAMERIVEQRNRLPEMRRHAREKSLEYAWPRIADRFYEACNDSAAKNHGAAVRRVGWTRGAQLI